MFSNYSDIYGQSVYYISHYEKNHADFNYRTLRNACRGALAVYILCMVLCFLTRTRFAITLPMVVLPILFLVMQYVIGRLEGIKESFGRIRILAFVCYTIIFAVMAWMDLWYYPNDRAVFFPMALLAFSAIYVDYLGRMIAYRVVVTIAYMAAVLALDKEWWLIYENIFTALAAACLSVLCYWAVLVVRVEQGYDSRVLEEKGSTDLLTGLFNKLAFEEHAREYLSGRAKDEQAALLIIDFDNFKSVNDNYGHLVGDKILKRFGEILHSNMRVDDIVGRVGGDEFMALMKGEIPEGFIEERCEIIQHELNTSHIGDAGGFSCSIGVIYDVEGFTFEKLYLLADDALYEAKARGKAQFVLWESRQVEPPEKKAIFLATPNEEVKARIRKSMGDSYIYIEANTATEALNGISLYQNYLDSVFFDFTMLDIPSEILHKYINSRPIFATIPVHDVATDL